MHPPPYAPDVAGVFPPETSLPILARALELLLVKPAYGPLLKTPPRDVAEAIRETTKD